jgi:hypothetical protein
VVDAAGTYVLTVNNSNNGCTATGNVVVTGDFTLPTISLGADTNLCPGASAMINATTNGTGLLWSTGETTTGITVTNAGTYMVTVTGSNGCMAKDSIHVHVNAAPTVQIYVADSLIGVCGDTLKLGLTTNASVYTWSNGSLLGNIYVTTSGSYNVTVTSALGCTATAMINVKLVDKSVHLNFPDTIRHIGCVVLDANAGANAQYIWCDGTSYPSERVCGTGYYCVSVTNQYGCRAHDSVYVIITPAVNLGNDTIIGVGGSITLDAGDCGGTPGITYLWSTKETTRRITVTQGGTYWARVSDSGGGYLGSDTINIREVAGVYSLNQFGDMKVYPNPSNGNIRVSFTRNEGQQINRLVIVNSMGQTIYTESLTNTVQYDKIIDLTRYNTGLYFLQVWGSGGLMASEKIVRMQ